jgi:predicted AlkP superfamily pyrophosphatase or phosphodiesterase
MASKKKLNLFIFIDAFGWEILQHHSFLDDLRTTKVPLGTVLGYSSTCIPTILTGKLPREHGHFSFFYYNPIESPFNACRLFSILPRVVMNRGRVRRILSKVIQRYHGYTGYFQIYNIPLRYLPLFDYSEKRDLYQPGGINPVTPTIFDAFREQNIPFYLSDWRAREVDNFRSLEASLEEGKVRFAYLYLAAMDALLHTYGPKSPIVDKKIGWYDHNIRQILKLARKNYDPVHFYVFSDHGMTSITEDYDLMAEINRLGLGFGKDYVAMYDSTMARFWFLNDTAREKVIKVLQKESRGQILSEKQLALYGCNFADHRYGELFFLLNPGILLCPSFMGEKTLAGMHGYAPEHKEALAMITTNVTLNPMPQQLEDLYGLMRKTVATDH